MKKQLLIAAAGATLLATYYIFRKRFGRANNLQPRPNHNHDKHHLTRVFANAKKHAMG